MSIRIAPQTPPYPASVQEELDRVMPPGVPPLVLFRVLARDPRLFARFAGGGLLDRGQLSLRERELVILRVCANHDSEYEWGVHVVSFAHKAGLNAEQIQATRHGTAEAACWSPRDRVLIELCDTLRTSCTLSEPLWQAVRAEFSEEAVLELLLLVGFYRTVSTLTGALQLPLEPWAARFA
jgi:alkylhydroperoxidase family enzyme